MPFVKVHMTERMLEQTDDGLGEEIRKAAAEVLDIGHDHGHVVLYGSPTHRRAIHESRNRGFVFVEILMFTGRTGPVKAELFRRVSRIIHHYTGISENDILLNAIETERRNWASKGGVPMDELDPGY